MNTEPTQAQICSICGQNYDGFGNNAFPINFGRCCDTCNALVVNHRITNVSRGRGAYQYPEWFNAELKDELSTYLKKLAKAEVKAVKEALD